MLCSGVFGCSDKKMVDVLNLERGQKFADCMIYDNLYVGTFGAVYEVKDFVSQDVAILKILSATDPFSEKPADKGQISWLVDNEVTALGHLAKEEGFPRLLRQDVEEDNAYLVISYEGPLNLNQFKTLQFGNYTPRKYELGLKLSYQAVQRVTVAHELNLVHQDIKPENFVISGEGKLSLIDWAMSAMGNNFLMLKEKFYLYLILLMGVRCLVGQDILRQRFRLGWL